jgi:hypothetical protein
MLKHFLDGLGYARPMMDPALAVADFVVVFRFAPGGRRRSAFRRRRQINASPPCLGQPNGNGLLRRTCAVLAPPNLVDFLAHKLASLDRSCLSRALVLARTFNCSSLRH